MLCDHVRQTQALQCSYTGFFLKNLENSITISEYSWASSPEVGRALSCFLAVTCLVARCSTVMHATIALCYCKQGGHEQENTSGERDDLNFLERV